MADGGLQATRHSYRIMGTLGLEAGLGSMLQSCLQLRAARLAE